MVLPAWLATTVHVPAPSKVTVVPFVPLTVQIVGVLVVKVTARWEVAVPVTVSGDWANVLLAKAAKVIVWAVVPVTVKLCVTAVRAA